VSQRTVLVTGAAGFIGSTVAGALLRRGDRVRGLDNFDPFYDPALKRRNLAEAGEFPVVEGDIRDPAAVREALRGCDAVIHLAAKAGVRPSLLDPVGYADVNLRGTAVVLEEALAAGIRTFVAASSSSVYGARSKVPFAESDPCDRPVSPYAATKRAMELHCLARQAATGIDLCCLRFFTTYGPRQRPEMAIHAFCRAVEDGRPLPFYGDGSSRRDYTYVDDVVDGVLRALDRSRVFRIYNLGESHLRGRHARAGGPGLRPSHPGRRGSRALRRLDARPPARLISKGPAGGSVILGRSARRDAPWRAGS
jgi:UDP-glucuronate 4-epimerase